MKTLHRPSPLFPISLVLMQFSAKHLPNDKLVPLSLGNPGSSTYLCQNYCNFLQILTFKNLRAETDVRQITLLKAKYDTVDKKNSR